MEISRHKQWMDRELDYVRFLLGFVLREESDSVPGIKNYIETLLSHPGKMLRPRLVITGARIAEKNPVDKDTTPLPSDNFDLSKLESLKKGFKSRIRQKIFPLPEDPEYKAWREEIPFEGALPNKIYLLAVAMEILHLASLAHDDVIDNSPIRRGFPSAPSELGNGQAVLMGDLLLTLCFTLVNEGAGGPVAQMLSGMVRLMVRSELAQSEDRNDFDNYISGNKKSSRKHYLRVIGGKTALLFAMALCSGAGEMDADSKLVDELQAIGIHLGLIFQIVDDILDFLSEEEKFGKFRGRDLLDGQITLPLIFALQKSERELLRQHINQFREGKEDLSQTIAFMKKSGSFNDCRNEINDFENRIRKHLGNLENQQCNPEPLNELEEILNFVISRNH